MHTEALARIADEAYGVAVLRSPPAFWRRLPGNYGLAYETEISD